MRIVAGLDGTRPSTIARRLLTATHWPPGSVVRVVGARSEDLDPGERAAIEVLPERRLIAPTGVPSLDLEVAPIRGSGAGVLLDAARSFGADLIVVGGHDAGDPDDETHGLALELVSRTSCAVLVARSPSITRILLAVDDSQGATRLPGTIARWQAFVGTPVDVVSVVPDDDYPTGFVTPWAPFAMTDSGRERRIARHLAIARRAARQLVGRGWSALPWVRSGVPSEEIVRAADEVGADLIVIASRGHHIDRPPHLGSVAGEVLMRARRSVLLIGPAAFGTRSRTRQAGVGVSVVPA